MEADLIKCEEILMMHKHCLEAFDKLFRDVCQNTYFLLKMVVLPGDFRQTVPVIPASSEHKINRD